MPKFTTTSQYLRASDLAETGDTVLPISSFGEESLMQGDRPMRKWILHFVEREEGLPLNASNGRVLCGLFGEEMNLWVGKQICLYVDPHIYYNGLQVGGIRARPFTPSLPS